MYLSTMLFKNICYDCSKSTAFMYYLSPRKRFEHPQYILVMRSRDSTDKFSRGKGVNFLWVDMEQTPVQAFWLPILSVKLDLNSNCLSLKDYLKIASSNIKEKLYLRTPQELCMNIPYSRVSQTMVPGNHRSKASPHPSLESTHFSCPFIAGIWWNSKKSNSKTGML